MAVDLHVHSNASDGTLSPSRVVAEAAEAGLAAIALCDHDSVDGVREAIAEGDRLGVRVVPAVELSADAGGRDVHVLGFFIRHEDPVLLDELETLRAARSERADRIVAALRADGYDIGLDEVLDLAEGAAVGRAHVARALVRRGHAEDVREAFERFIGREGPYYVRKTVPAPVDVVRLIRDAGGLPVLAHPVISRVVDLIEPLAVRGLAGIEAFHAEQSAEDGQALTELARRLGLVVTGGSDYHGPGTHGAVLGHPHVPDSVLVALEEAAERS